MKKIKYFLICCLISITLINSNYLLVYGENPDDLDYLTNKTSLSNRNIRVKISDKLISLETSPVLINNKYYIPLRKFFETIGFTVGWDGENQIIECENDTFIFSISVKENKVLLNEMEILLKDPLTIIDGNTMFSIESIEQLMFGQLTWNEDTRIIDVSKFDYEKIEALFKLTKSLFNTES